VTSNTSTLSRELIENTDAIVQRWYDSWTREREVREDVTEAALKDMLPQQLRVIGEQLAELAQAERPEQMWKIKDRLDPELRVHQDVGIEEVVQEYRVAVETVRRWIEEREIDVSFREYSYFYGALFELTAESVKRYAEYQAGRVRKDRAQYLAGLMHQLRTPLSSLRIHVDLLARRIQNAPARIPKLQHSLDRIEMLVSGVLRMERFDPSEVPVQPKPVRVAELVDGILEDHSPEAERKGVQLEARIDRALEIQIDPDLLVDALGNLVHNAVKFTEHGGVYVDAEDHDGEVIFHVRDTGPGIGADKLRTLLNEQQPGSAGGTGIGLQIAMHAARAQGGDLAVESSPGHGSLFSLRVPREVAARTPNRSAS
jgi:signal transduction histidine kinase